jgi:hypothetical protein
MNDLFEASPNGHLEESDGTYDYVNEGGALLFQVVRYSPKSFRQRRPDGAGGWIWNLGDVRRVIYRLPDVRRAVEAGELVAVVEGERDADRLSEAGICATTNAGGAGKWRDEYSASLRGARIIAIIPDNDAPGRDHAHAVARSLKGVVPIIRVIDLRGLPEHGDMSDWLTMGGTVSELLHLIRETPDWSPGAQKRRLPPPVSVLGLRKQVEQDRPQGLVSGIIPADANVLLAGYPKTCKTMFIEELVIALATGTSFLGKFPVAGRRKAGLVLMEDRQSSTLARLDRLCRARGVRLDDLDGCLHLWTRPPLSLSDETAAELGDYAAELELDFLAVDSWMYVASGNSNNADEVTSQLRALSAAKEKRPGLTVLLTHHARKERADADTDALRLTDLIRNSSAFGAWYDVGIMLSRRNENAPIKVRIEQRDVPAIPPFAVLVEDEQPGDNARGINPSGSLRLRASDESVDEIEVRDKAESMIPAVRKALQGMDNQTAHSKSALMKAVRGNVNVVDAAIELMRQRGEVIISKGAKGALAVTLRPSGA